jgi:predicted nucleic acid-binding Zn finger protein
VYCLKVEPKGSRRPDRKTRAARLVETRSIKLHRFLPSGREVWTAIGTDGDHLVDLTQPYCSCRDFHFGFITGRGGECYHLMAVRIAKESESYDTTVFQDEEYASFLRALLSELPHEG